MKKKVPGKGEEVAYEIPKPAHPFVPSPRHPFCTKCERGVEIHSEVWEPEPEDRDQKSEVRGQAGEEAIR